MEQKWGNSPSMPKLDPCSTPSRLDSQDFSFYNFFKSSPKIAIIDFPNMDREKGTIKHSNWASWHRYWYWATGLQRDGIRMGFLSSFGFSRFVSLYIDIHINIFTLSLSLSLSLCIYNICNNYYVYMCNIYIYIHVYNLYTSRTRPWQPCSWRWAFARSHPGEPSVAWLHPTARWSSSSATVPKKSPPLLVDLQLKAMVYANKNDTTKNLEWLGVY